MTQKCDTHIKMLSVFILSKNYVLKFILLYCLHKCSELYYGKNDNRLAYVSTVFPSYRSSWKQNPLATEHFWPQFG